MAEKASELIFTDIWKSILDEIMSMEDSEEKEIRENLLDEVYNSIFAYDMHLRDWEYGQLIKKWHERGIVFEPSERQPLLEKWDSMFRITTEKPRPFRWEELSVRDDVLQDRNGNTPASDAFDRAEKSTLAMFFDDCDEAYIIKGCENLTAADVEEMRLLSHIRKMDIYLMPTDGEAMWSYVTSHEQCIDFGPFFVVPGTGKN